MDWKIAFEFLIIFKIINYSGSADRFNRGIARVITLAHIYFKSVKPVYVISSVLVFSQLRDLFHSLFCLIVSWFTLKGITGSLVHAPGEVVWSPGGTILLHKLLDDFSALVHLVKVVLGNMFMNMQESLLKRRSDLEHWVFPELVDECFSLSELVIIPQDSFKQAATVELLLYMIRYGTFDSAGYFSLYMGKLNMNSIEFLSFSRAN